MVQVTYINPETGRDTQNILGFYAQMLRSGQTLKLPVRSPAMVFHVIEGAVIVGIDEHKFSLAEADTCCAPGFSSVTLHNASSGAPAFIFIATRRRCTRSSACSRAVADFHFSGGMVSQLTYMFAPPPEYSLPVRGTRKRLAVNRLFFVGRNYHAHAVEMGRPVDKTVEAPFYFTKSSSTLVESGGTIPIRRRRTTINTRWSSS